MVTQHLALRGGGQGRRPSPVAVEATDVAVGGMANEVEGACVSGEELPRLPGTDVGVIVPAVVTVVGIVLE